MVGPAAGFFAGQYHTCARGESNKAALLVEQAAFHQADRFPAFFDNPLILRQYTIQKIDSFL
jgi:hypothetical protein